MEQKAFDRLSNVAGRCQCVKCQVTLITVKIQLIDVKVSVDILTM